MFNIPAITWTLTAVLLLSGSYHLLQATKPDQLIERVNNSLHALMNLLMAAMLWNLAPSTVLAQIAVLTGAALWFIIQAVARPEFKILCTGSLSRLKCVYHSVSMAGAALMITMMTSHITPGAAETMPLPNAHHAMPLLPRATATATLDHLPSLATPLTIIFATAALIFIALLLRTRKPATTEPKKTAHSPREKHSLEALGAAIMALMFATMA
ncbi:DUF5134 domain-containing protein [Pseudarthrobacter sp. NBSH8]|uniref:DUF5134 domain-containing protein n=1 Tax=Pseudarthrobacter sp. NBSH8 TaxID=2596911 RepID=UPI00162AB2CD|nr:DUF5134 domain-containing protein [Pseudarthrobacter sp. NBSH8]QNE13134.1 DUF5134 domain-containing protein [Pseudarthrobacter sp. NBSH8]